MHTISTAVLPLFHLFGFWILAIQYLAFWAWSLAARRTPSTDGSANGTRRLHRSFLAIGAITPVLFLPRVTDPALLTVERNRGRILGATPYDGPPRPGGF